MLLRVLNNFRHYEQLSAIITCRMLSKLIEASIGAIGLCYPGAVSHNIIQFSFHLILELCKLLNVKSSPKMLVDYLLY